jgi:anti-sigma factor RsiW
VSHRASHLQEERLFESYLAERAGEPLDPPVAEHLADCASCGSRYTELSSFMDTLRRDGDAEADAIFTPERLRIQQQQILRRMSLVGRPARVLSFPGRIVRRTIDASTSRTAPRWAAAAAAAGLFVGVAVGAPARPRPVAESNVALHPSGVGTGGRDKVEIAADDAFLSDLEIALERPHTRELQAFDALTPHVREVRDER